MTLVVILVGTLALVLASVVLDRRRRRRTDGRDDIAAVLAGLASSGSDLTKPHDIDCFLYAPTEEGATRLVTALATRGFRAPSASARDGEWCVQGTMAMVPDAEALATLGSELETLASVEGGRYDGWGATVVA